MTAERFRQIRNVFEAAMDQSDAVRPAWLAKACHSDESLRAEVDALLRQHQRRSGVLDLPAISAEELADAWRLEGRHVGPWEILREIGRGGMGVVYLARRADGAFQMSAAVKVLTMPFADEETRKRFRREREILAQLSHPNIARLLDGGTTESGLSYLVMEYVDGQLLTTWCDARKAPVEERLRLFGELCEVVRYLHDHGVIHRDLKPANVLVNGEGKIKLLDFGITKLLGPVGEQTVLPTQSGLHLLTPEYASPEQVKGERVTPQTDVYALGVIAYELLTGRRPYAIRSRVMHAVLRAICEEEPERPSAAVRRPDEALNGTAIEAVRVGRLRQSSPERLSLALRGDLDEILMKALRKAPERRYRTAGQLSDDLSAYNQGKSVLARGDSWPMHALRKLNDYRLAVVLLIGSVALVASGAVTVHTRAIPYGAAALVVLGVWYAATDARLGRRNFSAGPLITVPVVFLMGVGMAVLMNSVRGRVVFSVLFSGLAIYSLSSVSGWMRRHRWAGELILDASETRKGWYLFAALIWVSSLLFPSLLFTAMGASIDQLIFKGSMVIFHSLAWAFAGKLEFRKGGIVQPGSFIPWDEIQSWSWGSQGRMYAAQEKLELFDALRGVQFEPAILKIERRRLIQFLGPVSIKVSPLKLAAITRVMNWYLGEWPPEQAGPERTERQP